MEHEHIHSHTHSHDEPSSESVALLSYMIQHNEHHAEELVEISNGLENDAKQLVLEAVGEFEKANEKLKKAFALVKGE